MNRYPIALALVMAPLACLVVVSGCGSTSQGAAGAGGAGSGGPADGGAGAGGKGGSVGASLPACPGVDPTPTAQACRSSADCAQRFWTCGPTYQAGGCGACLPPVHQCDGDGGCSADLVCVPAADPCHCNFVDPGMMCTSRCTATSCGVFAMCDTASGLCKPKTCGLDFACGSGLTCAPMRAGADVNGCAVASCATDGYQCPAGTECTLGAGANANGCSPISCVGGAFQCPPNTDCKASSTSPHHCQRRACTADGSCDCGACIQGLCQDRLFVCSPPPPS